MTESLDQKNILLPSPKLILLCQLKILIFLCQLKSICFRKVEGDYPDLRSVEHSQTVAAAVGPGVSRALELFLALAGSDSLIDNIEGSEETLYLSKKNILP